MKHFLKLITMMSLLLANACQQGGGDTSTAQKKPATSSANSQTKDAATGNGAASNSAGFTNYSGSCFNTGVQALCRDHYYSDQSALDEVRSLCSSGWKNVQCPKAGNWGCACSNGESNNYINWYSAVGYTSDKDKALVCKNILVYTCRIINP